MVLGRILINGQPTNYFIVLKNDGTFAVVNAGSIAAVDSFNNNNNFINLSNLVNISNNNLLNNLFSNNGSYNGILNGLGSNNQY